MWCRVSPGGGPAVPVSYCLPLRSQVTKAAVGAQPKSTHRMTYRPAFAYVDDLANPILPNDAYRPDWRYSRPVFCGLEHRIMMMSRTELPN